MRSNFIKVLESCTVCDFSRSFYKCSIRILTVCVWMLAQVCAPVQREWMCAESRGTATGFWLCNYLTHKCNMCRIKWKRSIRRGEVAVCHPHFQTELSLCGSILYTYSQHIPFNGVWEMQSVQLGRGPVWSHGVVNVNHSWTSSLQKAREENEDGGGSFSSSQVAGSGTVAHRSTPQRRCVQINGILRGQIWKLPLMEHQW